MSVINTNITSMIGQQNLQSSQSNLQTSMERLSSGLRINSAKDDAAGQAIANRMTAQITGLSQAQRNANDGISIAQTAEGSLNQINDNLQRVRELTVQAQNGTNSSDDLQSIQEEVNQRMEEINRISRETDFNGVRVLSEDTSSLSIQVGANDGQTIEVNLRTINQTSLELDGFNVTGSKAATASQLEAEGFVTNDDGANYHDLSNAEVDTAAALAEVADGDTAVIDGETYTYNGTGTQWEDSGTNSVDIDSLISNATESASLSIAAVSTNLEVDLNDTDVVTDGGNTVYTWNPGTAQFSSDLDAVITAVDGGDLTPDSSYALNEATNTYRNTAGETAFAQVGDDNSVTITTAPDERATVNPLETLDAALKDVDSLRSELGAVQNRFESAITNLSTNETNLSAARSRIEDADYATEVADMTRSQILQQAGTSVLAQANQIPQNVLSLLG